MLNLSALYGLSCTMSGLAPHDGLVSEISAVQDYSGQHSNAGQRTKTKGGLSSLIVDRGFGQDACASPKFTAGSTSQFSDAGRSRRSLAEPREPSGLCRDRRTDRAYQQCGSWAGWEQHGRNCDCSTQIWVG